MAERSIEQLTLVDKFREADQLARALIDHLDRGFLPKVRDLERLVRPNPHNAGYQDVSDLRVRNYVANVISSDDFTSQNCRKLDQYIQAIDNAVSREINV